MGIKSYLRKVFGKEEKEPTIEDALNYFNKAKEIGLTLSKNKTIGVADAAVKNVERATYLLNAYKIVRDMNPDVSLNEMDEIFNTGLAEYVLVASGFKAAWNLGDRYKTQEVYKCATNILGKRNKIMESSLEKVLQSYQTK